MTILLFITKIFVCSGILFGYYWVFLRNKKFHHYNRFYLLAITVLSLAIPFLKIPVFIEAANHDTVMVYKSLELISVNNWEEEFVESKPSVFQSWLTVQNSLYVLYGLGILILLFILLRSLLYIKKIIRQYPHERIDKLKFYNTEEPGTPFSFFQSVFWNRNLNFNSKEGQQIFRHELFHVKQHHSADLLFLELVSIVFWINPFFHLIKKELKAIHEFLADQYAISNNNQYEYAELLVMQSINAKRSSISNYFFQNHIKRRIAMITQFKNKNYTYWSRVMILPIVSILFCAFVLHTQQPATLVSANTGTLYQYSNALDEPITILIDAGHGGEVVGARSSDAKFFEKDLTLAIALKIKKLAAGYKNLNIIMTREADVYPAIKDRPMMAATADLIVSIHINAAPKKSANGFEAYITAKEDQNKFISKKIAESILHNIAGVYTTIPIIKQRNENGIWILDAAPCPAVLVECGYITNEKDLAFITQPENQDKIAKSILNGIVSYHATKTSENPLDTVPQKNKNANRQQYKQNKELSDAEIEALKKQQEEVIKQYELLMARQRQLQLLQQKTNASQMENLKKHELNIQKQRELLLEKEYNIVLNEQNQQQELLQKELEKQRQQQKYLMKQAELEERKNYERVLQFEKEQQLIVEKQKEVQALHERMEEEHIEELQKQQNLNEQINQNKQPNKNQSNNRDTFPDRRNMIFTKVENPPTYPGGMEGWKNYLIKNLQYPEEAKKKNISGTVIVQFIVEKNGELSEVQAIKSPVAGLTEEAIRVIKESGKWIPAKQNGHIVRAYHKQPIVFTLEKQ